VDVSPLELAHRAEVNECLRRCPPEISEHTFTNLYVWREWRPVFLANVADALCFLEEHEGERHLLGPPIGDADPVRIAAELREAGVEHCVRLPQGTAQALREAGLTVEADRNNSDYVYWRQDLVELPGRAYHRQKNLVNRCLARFRCEYCELTAEVVDEVGDMQDRWCAEKDCGQSPTLCAEYRAIGDTLARFAQFGLLGGAVRIDGRIEAYTVGESLNPGTAVVHFEKAMRPYEGLYQVVNQWFCRHALTGFEFVNREQDLGIPGLRKAKESYHPHHMVDKYVATAPGEPVEPLLRPRMAGRCRE
jgi:hypothetical protein